MEGDEGDERAIEAALAAIARNDEPSRLLDLLDAASVGFVADDVIHRLVPFASRLASLSYDHHPWAALPAGVAICAIDRPLGRCILSGGRERFEAEGDPRGAAFAWFLEGLQDLGEGNLDGATRWWRQAQDSLDPSLTAARLTLAHLALGAYERGELQEAIVLAEQALWSAQHVGDARTESLAAIYLGFFHLYTGRVGRCGSLIEQAYGALDRLEPENRYEFPLAHIEAGALATLRGDDVGAEQHFDIGLDQARRDANEWYTAIGLTIRAEFTAPSHPVRAVGDARAALDHLDPIAEAWWSRWARLALATAHLHADNVHAGREACHTLLQMEVNPVERGRTLLVLAELEDRAGRDDKAAIAACESLTLLSTAGADFWAARALLVLSRVDRRNAEFHRRKARQLAAGDLDDPAWRRLLRGPGRLRINLLGDATVLVDDAPVRFSTRAEVEVLAMLVCADGPVRTSVIGDRLWPDHDQAKVSHRVDNLLSSLRRALLPATRVRRERGMVWLEIDLDECDLTRAVTEARDVLATDPTVVDPVRVRRTAERLERPLLGSLEAPWTMLEQERLQSLADQITARLGS